VTALGARALRLPRCWIAAALLLDAAAPAAAQSAPELSLTWEAPPGCPQRDGVEAAIRRWVAESAEPLDPGSVEVDGHVIRERGAFVLDLELQSNAGQSRERLRAQRCETFANLVGLKVSLAATPRDAHGPRSAARGRRAGTSATTTTGQRAATDQGEGADPARVGVVPGLRLVAGAGFGALPGIGAQGALFGNLVLARFRFELGVTAGLPKQVHYVDSSLGAELWLIAGVARTCWSPLTGGLELPLCAGVELGVIHARTLGRDRASAEDGLWAAAVFGPALRFGLAGPVSFWFELEASVAWVQTHYALSGRELLFSSDRFAGSALAGVELSL
jgi:hypothetical protein